MSSLPRFGEQPSGRIVLPMALLAKSKRLQPTGWLGGTFGSR